MKKKVWIFLTGLICLCILGGIYHIKKHSSAKMLPPNPNVQEVAIYVDIASFPTLLQMVDVVKSDPEMPKLIFWERRRSIPQDLPILKNAQIISQKDKVAFIDEQDREGYLENLRQKIQEFIARYPNAVVTAHLNFLHCKLTWAVLSSIPKERIKQIYWEEDAFGNTLLDTETTFAFNNPETFSRVLALRNIDPQFPKLAALPFYPSTFRLAHPEMLERINKDKMNYIRKYAKVEAINFEEIAASLTPKQKDDLLQLAGLSSTDIAYFKQGKPVMLDILGVSLENNELDELQLADLDRVFSGKFGAFQNPDDYVWLVKEHPWLKKNNELKKNILSKYPFMHFLPKDFPLEALFLAGYVPNKMFGYSSSVFFAIPDAEHMLFYIPRPADPYVPWLIKFGKLRKEQVFAGDILDE